MTNFDTESLNLENILDFIRFGISAANEAQIYCGHGTENARDDIFALILDSLFLPHDLDSMFYTSNLTAKEKKKLVENLHKRIEERIPTPYITNKAYFCDLEFFVDKRVLIPRSPIAELIKTSFAPWVDPGAVHNILDLCTGSGCIAIACAYAFPDAQIDASDISQDALDVAAINREQHPKIDNLNLLKSDGFNNIPHKKYDIIVSNPPYVSQTEMQTLPAEYLHEPKLALEATDDGLKVVKEILRNASNFLSEKGVLIVEVGNSDSALQEAYPDVPFTWLEFEHGGSGVFLLTAAELQKWQIS